MLTFIPAYIRVCVYVVYIVYIYEIYKYSYINTYVMYSNTLGNRIAIRPDTHLNKCLEKTGMKVSIRKASYGEWMRRIDSHHIHAYIQK